MILYAAIPSIVVGLVLYMTRWRRLALAAGLLTFVIVLIALVVFSSGLTIERWDFPLE